MMLLLLVRLVTSTRVGVHGANPTSTTDSSVLEFALSSLCAAFDEQYESIPDDEITLLVRKFRALHGFRKGRRRSPRVCFECDDTTHFITDCPKQKKFDSYNKYNYNNWNDSNNYNFTGLCLVGKSSWHISNSDSDVSDNSSPEGLSL
jgi:hypothetical protein